MIHTWQGHGEVLFHMGGVCLRTFEVAPVLGQEGFAKELLLH